MPRGQAHRLHDPAPILVMVRQGKTRKEIRETFNITYAALNSIIDRERTKTGEDLRTPHSAHGCRLCGETGHNKRTCPNRGRLMTTPELS